MTNGTCPLFLVDFVQGKHDTCSPSTHHQSNSWLFDNVASVFFHVMETFSKDFLEVRGLRSRGFQLLLHELQQRCARNFEKNCNCICWITVHKK